MNALAGMIYASFHPDTNIRPPKPRGGHRWHFRATNHFYVDFYHTGYRVFEHYPFGLLNVVGYWAETELFGGVVLFERVESGSEVHSILLIVGNIQINERQIINAFLHPQATSYAFQLSENQLKSFVDLGITGEAVKIPGAENVLPFAKDPDARTEPTYVTAGEAPLRIYKNEYDMPPIEYAPEESGCVVLEDERYERAMRIVKEEGLWKHARRYPAIFQDQPSLRDAYSAPNDAYSPLEDGPLNEPEDPENPDHK